MDCPYCFSSIHEDASICPHCRSDLAVIKPLLKRVAALEAQVESMSTRLVVSSISDIATAEPSNSLGPEADSGNESSSEEFVEWAELDWRRVASGILMMSVALMFLHWLLLFVYDIRPLILRVVTLVLPMLTGYVLLRRHVVSLTLLTFGSIGLGLMSVAGMLCVTGYLDGVSVWPSSPREWREVIEYVMGIALGLFSAGLLVRFQHDLSVSLAKARQRRGKWFFLERNPDGTVKAAKFAMEVSKFVNAAAPVASGATALYAGLKSVLGN